MVGNILVALVALIHLYIVYLEMALWDTPQGHKAFNLTPEFAKESKVLAANQGLYNGFLAAGLLWGLYLGAAGFQVKLFFLICVAIAGTLRRGHRGKENPLHPDGSGGAGPDRGLVRLVMGSCFTCT